MQTTLNSFRALLAPRAIRSGLVLFLLTAAAAFGAERKVTITVPATAAPKAPLTVAVSASTDFGGGEQIGFLHAEYSIDGGKTWTRLVYATTAGAKAEYGATFDTGPAGSKVIVRARTAFRGGKAGDVDLTGAKIEWDKTWNAWGEPPTKIASVTVK